MRAASNVPPGNKLNGGKRTKNRTYKSKSKNKNKKSRQTRKRS